MTPETINLEQLKELLKFEPVLELYKKESDIMEKAMDEMALYSTKEGQAMPAYDVAQMLQHRLLITVATLFFTSYSATKDIDSIAVVLEALRSLIITTAKGAAESCLNEQKEAALDKMDAKATTSKSASDATSNIITGIFGGK